MGYSFWRSRVRCRTWRLGWVAHCVQSVHSGCRRSHFLFASRHPRHEYGDTEAGGRCFAGIMTTEFVRVTTEREQSCDMRLRIFAALSGARKCGRLIRWSLRYVAAFCGLLRTNGGNSPAKNAGHPWGRGVRQLPVITNCSGKHRHTNKLGIKSIPLALSGHAFTIGLYALSYGQSTNMQWGDA